MNRRLKAQIIKAFGKQNDFAKVINRSPHTISKTIHGKYQLSHQEQMRWANALGCGLGQIFQPNSDGSYGKKEKN